MEVCCSVSSPFVLGRRIYLGTNRDSNTMRFPQDSIGGYIGLFSLFFAHSLTQQAAGLSVAPSVHMKTRLRQRRMPLHMAYVESQTVCQQCSMHFCHHPTFSLCSSASLVLQMLHRVKAIGFGDHEITVAKRCLTMQRNQHSGTERHQLSLIAGFEATLRDLGYSMNASRRPKPSSKRRNATPMIEGSIGEHCQAGGHTYTIYKWHVSGSRPVSKTVRSIAGPVSRK
jgi:hypothetical protein